jgi:ribosomal protein S21
MAINVQVTKQGNENTASVLRKFSYKVRSSGILMHVRKIQNRVKPKSRNMRKFAALSRLQRRKQIEKMVKEGRIPERKAKIVATSVSGK